MKTNLWAALLVLATASIAAAEINGSALSDSSAIAPAAAKPELKPFVMPALSVPGPLVDLRPIFPGPRGKDFPAVTVSAGHFYAAGQPVRFWGVNLVFGACFPPHDVADKVAARLAAFGVNCVRFHHMDMREYPDGIWAKDFHGFSPEALDRLDYLLAALKKEGVYANLNLHVSRDFSRTGGKMAKDELPHFGKEVDLFDPELIALQKDYARDLLGHKNAYTGLTYAADPVTALVELTNEDSVFIDWSWYNREPLSPRFEKELVGLWNDWLAAKYKSDAALKTAWSVGEEPLSNNVNDVLWLNESEGTVSAIDGATANAEIIPQGVEISVEKLTGTDWHVQYSISGVHLEKGKTYTLGFCAKADKTRDLAMVVQQQNSPWRHIGAGKTFHLTENWDTYTTTFVAWADEPNTKIGFILGQAKGRVTISGVNIQPGGRDGLRDYESLKDKNIARMFPFDIATDTRIADYFLFLADTERRYFSGMRDYLKKDLGVRAPITGTTGVGPLSALVQAEEMDFVDAHDYWQHPSFPHKQWDARDWTIPNTAMVDDPQHSALVQLAACRVLYGSDKSQARPFTVTEYNHAAPNDYQAEGIPMIASFAAAQDWDGVFLFDYHASADWTNQDAMRTYFSIDTNPVKMAEMAAGALLFRRGDIAPLPVAVVTGLPPDRLAALMVHYSVNTEWLLSDPLIAAPPAVRFFGRYALAPFDFGAKEESKSSPATMIMEPNKSRLTLPPPDAEKCPIDWKSGEGWMFWTTGKDRGSGIYRAAGELSAVFVGFTGGREFWVGPMLMMVKGPKFVAVTISSLDGRKLGESNRVLIVAAGRTENTGQQWNDSRTSVADQWGHGPSLIEMVNAQIAYVQRGTPHSVSLQALDGEGKNLDDLYPIFSSGRGYAEAEITDLGIGKPTIWYILEIK